MIKRNAKYLSALTGIIICILSFTGCLSINDFVSDDNQSSTIDEDEYENRKPEQIPDSAGLFVDGKDTNWLNPFDLRLYNFTPAEKTAYKAIVEGFANNLSPIKFPKDIKEEQASMLYSLAKNSMYEYDNLPNDYTINKNRLNSDVSSISVKYKCSTVDTKRMKNQLQIKADEIISGISSDMTQWDRIKYIHDYIINNCDYDLDAPHPNSAYGTLVDGRATCEGYSKAFAYMCNKTGIECILITGSAGGADGEESNHMWNMVKCDDKWYHIDVTWDDSYKDEDKSDDEIAYWYFNLTTEEIKKDHTTIDANRYYGYPDAISMDANYYVHEKLYIDDNSNATAIITEALKKAIKSKQKAVGFKTSNEQLFKSVGKLMSGQKLPSILNRINSQNNYIVNTNKCIYRIVEANQVYEIIIEYK